jgi:hypothetical protein
MDSLDAGLPGGLYIFKTVSALEGPGETITCLSPGKQLRNIA